MTNDREVILDLIEGKAKMESITNEFSGYNECKSCDSYVDCRYYSTKTGDTLCDIVKIIK